MPKWQPMKREISEEVKDFNEMNETWPNYRK